MASDQRPRHGFGAVLRDHRRRAGLTQEELAARAAIGVRTVRDLEHGRASRPQRTTAELLAQALGLSGSEQAAFLAAARGRPADEVPVDSALTGVSVHSAPTPFLRTPPTDELIGRDADLAGILARLSADGGSSTTTAGGSRGVTLVGVAGVGKSSLAMAAAHRLAGGYPGGVAAVVVPDDATAGELLDGVAIGFGATAPELLAGHLGDRPALLLVDGVDRAPEVVAEVLATLLEQIPRLRFLATARRAGEHGELIQLVAPLAAPPPMPQAETVDELIPYPAVGLFLERLGRVRRTRLAPHEIAPLAALVRRLGGLPLAIELAAARGRVLSVSEILTYYAEPVTPLRAVVAESYRLLSPVEQRALRVWSVFRHRWSRGLGEALLDTSDDDRVDVVHMLDRLIALGLLTVSGDDVVRFRLPAAVRDFATGEAAAAGELEDARKRYDRLLLDIADHLADHVVPDLAP
ncbi:ATP-binding protein [Actinoplanes awajinensis]|uniref:HTH cro/C1-type domain-containing protein n=1 Tax=Actinoplanes awajinensis subsp. mycoplanecinus TaxID=135947 RepID=A0A101JGT2_9ACTN|nr:helix-turn-helix domain-containing protein [Actinoplanes awajinensis]KUL26474.1 hypothetical protein ADL15_37925 [Actinoplanes awajinensis subsp. mycoplanecinus]